jgi:hypothetical protein
MSGTMNLILNVNGTMPSNQTYIYYVIGGAISYLVIAIFSEWIYGNRKKFFPLFVWVVIGLLY